MSHQTTTPNAYDKDANGKWAHVNWGNLNSNVEFLNRTGLLANPQTILEIGSGRGSMLRWLLAQGHNAVGVDLDPDFVGECVSAGLPVTEASGDKLPFESGSFDLVLSFDVFEHIPDTDRHLREVRRVLRAEGWYLFQTPNKWTNIPFEIIRWSRDQGIRHVLARDFLKPPEHCALHNYWQLQRRLLKHGFVPEYHDIPVVNQYFKGKVKRILGSAGLVALRVLNPDRLPMPLHTNFYVSARKIDKAVSVH